VISPDDTNDFMEDLSNIIGQHIDDFIHVGKCGWDMGSFVFYGDPIYDIEGNFQIRNA
jgi:hypothetical protein